MKAAYDDGVVAVAVTTEPIAKYYHAMIEAVDAKCPGCGSKVTITVRVQCVNEHTSSEAG